ncbi:MAG: helix-turn-helix transcriptional regulator [Gemmataceae bacterium]
MMAKKKVFYTIKEIATLFGVTDRTVRRWKAAGKLPTPVTPTKNTIRWRVEDIHALNIACDEQNGGNKR